MGIECCLRGVDAADWARNRTAVTRAGWSGGALAACMGRLQWTSRLCGADSRHGVAGAG